MTSVAQLTQQVNQPISVLEVNLVKAVEELLIREGCGTNLPITYYGNRLISEAVGKNSTTQRFLLNKFWNLQIGLVEGGGINERYNLLRDGSFNDWVTSFEKNVLPFIKKNQLPREI